MRDRCRIVGLLLTVGLFMLAGCDRSDAPPTDVASPIVSSDPKTASVLWTQCMRDNGVDIPDPKTDSADGDVAFGVPPGATDDTDPETFQSALKACKQYAKDMGGGADSGDPEADKERMLKFAKCMRDNGVDMPDPDIDAAGGRTELRLPDPNDPKAAEAREACRDSAPTGP